MEKQRYDKLCQRQKVRRGIMNGTCFTKRWLEETGHRKQLILASEAVEAIFGLESLDYLT